MGQIPARYSEDAEEKFHQQLTQYDTSQLQLVYEYFKDDLIIIVQSIKTEDLLERLAARKIINEEMYLQRRSDLGDFTFSTKLVEDIQEGGRESIIGLLEILYNMQEDYWLHDFTIIQDELKYYGDTFLQLLILDQEGHPMNNELKELQEHHKHHLLETYWTEATTQKTIQEDEHLFISDGYMPLVVTTIPPFHRQNQNRYIETGVKHGEYVQTAHSYAERVSAKRLFRWSQQLRFAPHAVMLSGVAGVGKTTMLQKLICDWAKGKLYQRFTFVFYFHFQDLNKLEVFSLQSMILQQYPYLGGRLEGILKDADRLLFIFDGFDECVDKVDFKSRQLCRDPKRAERVGTIVASLVRQSLLKGCSILLASRPEKLAVMDFSVFRRVMEIIGFLPKERWRYYERFFMNKDLSDRAFSFVEENGVLFTFSYLPSFCWIVCGVMSTFFKAQQTTKNPPLPNVMSTFFKAEQTTKNPPLPKTLTQLFVAFVANILSSYGSGEARDLLPSIGELAEYGTMNHITRFQKQTLLQFNVDLTSKIFPRFLKESDNAFSFRFPMIPEFLAALAHYRNYSPEKLRNSLEKASSCKDNRGQIFLCFLCGLSDFSTRSTLEPFLGELSSNAAQEVLTWHQQYTSEVEFLDLFQDTKRKLLNVLFRLFETQNKDFVLKCLGSCKSLDFNGVSVSPLDCHVLTFILESCRENEGLTLSNATVTCRHLTRLSPGLHTLCSLSLFNTVNVGDEGAQIICAALTHPDSRIHSLCLTLAGLTHLACSYFGPAIIQNQSLRILSLTRNRLEGPHFSDLMAALCDPACKIEHLYLESTHLTDSSSPQLILGIKGNQSLKKLNLSFNNLSGPHLGELMSAFSSPTCNIEELWLQAICLRNEDLPLLMGLTGNRHLTLLQLSYNDDITDAGVEDIKEFLLRSPSLKHVDIFLYRLLSSESRKAFLELKTQKPDLNVWC